MYDQVALDLGYISLFFSWPGWCFSVQRFGCFILRSFLKHLSIPSSGRLVFF
jgi:hypothetical protein